MKYADAYELPMIWLMPCICKELEKRTHDHKKSRGEGKNCFGITHSATAYKGKAQLKRYNLLFVLHKFYSFCSAAFCCLLCISSLCSCSRVSSDTPN